MLKMTYKDYRGSLKALRDARDDCLKQIDENPFLRGKWTWLDRLFASIAGYELPIPQKEYMKKKVELDYLENKYQLDEMYRNFQILRFEIQYYDESKKN